MNLILQGKILTPIITKRTSFRFGEFHVKITKPRRRYYNKIISLKPMYPYSLICYLGEIEVQCFCKTQSKLERKLNKLLNIKFLGRFWSEGLGQIRWLKGYNAHSAKQKKNIKPIKKVKIRKGLPDQISEEVQKLVQYALLHDFYNTSRHKSKIYGEPEINNSKLMEILREHHEKTDNPLILTFQHYDRLGARLTRKFRSPRTNRYNWYATKTIDFTKLADEIAEVADHPWKLYEYIYQSEELSHLTVSLQQGHTSLQGHLLIVTNLIVHDYLSNRLCFCTPNDSEYRFQHV